MWYQTIRKQNFLNQMLINCRIIWFLPFSPSSTPPQILVKCCEHGRSISQGFDTKSIWKIILSNVFALNLFVNSRRYVCTIEPFCFHMIQIQFKSNHRKPFSLCPRKGSTYTFLACSAFSEWINNINPVKQFRWPLG